jgi:hypothetical protein
MKQAFLTSRRGLIENITVYRYDFFESIIADQTQKEKLKYWLEKKSGFSLYDIEDTCFYTFTKLSEDITSQYRLNSSKTLVAPFNNNQLISNFIGTLLRTELAKHYQQFLNQNVFSVQTIDLYPFQLIKAISFNVEVFSTGHYLIHISPITKIVSSKNPIEKSYISYLHTTNKNNSSTAEMEFNLVNTDKFYRRKIDLLDKELNSRIDGELKNNSNFIATFDYHFLANYSPELFGKISENTSKNLKQTVLFINLAIDKFQLPDSFNLSTEKYFKVDVQELEAKSNLLVGCQHEVVTLHSKSQTQHGIRLEYTRDSKASDKIISIFPKNEEVIEQINELDFPTTLKAKVEQRENWGKPYITKLFTDPNNLHTRTNTQSASYYNGIFKAVNNWNILPIIYDDLNLEIINELLNKFNKNGRNFKILETIYAHPDLEITKERIKEIIEIEKNKTLIIVLSRHKLTNDFFKILASLNLKFQIYFGDIDNSMTCRARLSNFVCKCLERMGGIISAIANTYTGKDGYFIGIDLGHTTVGENKYSNFATVMFDCNGILIESILLNKIPLQENLTSEWCAKAFNRLSNSLIKKKLSAPSKIVIHRDGKLHSNDVQVLTESLTAVFGAIEIDIVEIIKSGFPIIVIKDENNAVINPHSGNSYQDIKHKYAILITNNQADEHSSALRPIIIKHKFGSTEFQKVVEQVYWFTKIYSNNLYFSTRLPATTQIANDIAITSKTKKEKTTAIVFEHRSGDVLEAKIKDRPFRLGIRLTVDGHKSLLPIGDIIPIEVLPENKESYIKFIKVLSEVFKRNEKILLTFKEIDEVNNSLKAPYPLAHACRVCLNSFHSNHNILIQINFFYKSNLNILPPCPPLSPISKRKNSFCWSTKISY